MQFDAGCLAALNWILLFFLFNSQQHLRITDILILNSVRSTLKTPNQIVFYQVQSMSKV